MDVLVMLEESPEHSPVLAHVNTAPSSHAQQRTDVERFELRIRALRQLFDHRPVPVTDVVIRCFLRDLLQGFDEHVGRVGVSTLARSSWRLTSEAATAKTAA